MCSQHGQMKKRNFYPNMGRVVPQDCFFGRYRVNYQVPIGIQLNEAHKYAVVENNITSQTCKQKGGWGGVLTIPGCEGRLFLFFFSFF